MAEATCSVGNRCRPSCGSKIADEEGVGYATKVIHVKDDDAAREIARTLKLTVSR
jgi:hypothetical protein